MLYPHSAVRQSAVQKVMGGILGMSPATDPNILRSQPQKTAEGADYRSTKLSLAFRAFTAGHLRFLRGFPLLFMSHEIQDTSIESEEK